MASSKYDLLRKHALSRDNTNKALSLIGHLEKKPEAGEFLEPVDYRGLGLGDYPLIVKQPMDLSTVKKKLKSSQYFYIGEVISDLNLIWENCKTYNQIGSAIAKQADNMASHMKKFCAKHRINIENNERTSSLEEPTADLVLFENKVALAERVRKANHTILTEIVKTVEAQCREALDEIDAERIQIKVDSLDKATFDKLWNIVSENDPSTTLKKHKISD